MAEDDKNLNCDDDFTSANQNTWKPLRMDLAFLGLSQNEKKTSFLLRTFTSQLNKLTSENAARLLDRIKNLPIDTLTRMRGVVDIIYEKAIREENYLSLYAQVCDVLKNKQVLDEAGGSKTFLMFLLSRCDECFDICLAENLVYERRKFEIDLIDCKKTRKLLKAECRDRTVKSSNRIFGNCLLIGELLKWEIFQTKEMILPIINRLIILKYKKLSNILIAAILMRVGKCYKEKFLCMSSKYFEDVETLCGEDLPPRIRFFLLDLLDLRRNSWCPRIRPELPIPSDNEIDFDIGDSENDFNIVNVNNDLENRVPDASHDKIQETEAQLIEQKNFQNERNDPDESTHDGIPVGILFRETFDSVANELKEQPKGDELSVSNDDVKCGAKKYTTEFLSSCRSLPQCNKPITISSPQFADKLLETASNCRETSTYVNAINHKKCSIRKVRVKIQPRIKTPLYKGTTNREWYWMNE